MDERERTQCGESGRKFCLENGLTAEMMGAAMKQCINTLFEIKPNNAIRYTLKPVTQNQYENIGII